MTIPFSFPIAIMGAENSGKSQILNGIITKPFNPVYEPTIGLEFGAIADEQHDVRIQIFDLSGAPRFNKTIIPYYSNKQVCLYCVDLSAVINIEKINEDILTFKTKSKNADVLLVGTKLDLCNAEALEKFRALNVDASQRFETSAKDALGIEGLTEQLLVISIKAQRLDMPKQQWRSAKDSLNRQLSRLPRKKADALKTALEKLDNTIKTIPDSHDKVTEAIDTFVT